MLLGGQAARAGVACETCHRNGRTNPDFAFPGVSGAPGTADVTSFVFSSHRGDHIDDPRPIPDLGGAKASLKVSQAPGSPALKAFIHDLITDEFDGAEPPPEVLDGLVAYVRALSPAACKPGGAEPVTARDTISDTLRAIAAAQTAMRRGEKPTAIVMLQAARAQLGNLAERYDVAALRDQHERLAQASIALGAVADETRRGDVEASESLAVWLSEAHIWRAAVMRAEPLSLYDPGRLALALAGQSGASRQFRDSR